MLFIKNIKEISLKLSKSDLTVLIEGESGNGKEYNRKVCARI